MAKKTKKPVLRKRVVRDKPVLLGGDRGDWVRTALPPMQGLPKAPQLEPSRTLLPENKF